ncbi:MULTISPECIES: hypothetical protein [Pseudomonas]|uniref:hypothetical protein n=1 Tax=Pseudomonas TaxID=286 RepID=UPI001473FD24|nr:MULTISPECIES: hypothetical protein [Pseudomonas]NMY99743.1 hypothetical protein [Pseudomonas proteolytica]
MTFSSLFRPESDPVRLDNTFNYLVLNSFQWKDAHLEVMTKAAKQSFAVLALQASILKPARSACPVA